MLDALPYSHYNDSVVVAENNIDILDFSTIKFKSLFYSHINAHKLRRRSKMRQDSIYDKICETIFVASDHRLRKNSWSKSKKYVYKSLIKQNSNYRYFRLLTFHISLVNYLNKKYYYDNTNSDNGLHLIYGTKEGNEIKKNKNDSFIYPLIKPKTQLQFLNDILSKLIRLFSKSNFKSSHFNRIGFSIRVDKDSLHKKALPRAKIVVMIGGKIMSKIRI